MKRKFLEELGLEKDVIDKILDENSADIGKVKGELESTKQSLKEAQEALSKVEESTKDNSDLQKQLEEYKTKFEQAEAERATQAKQFAIKKALKDTEATDIDYMLYKLGDVEVDKDGNIKDLDNKIKALKEANPNHFKQTEEPKKGFTVVDTKLGQGTEPSDTDTMTAQLKRAMGLNFDQNNTN